MATLTSANGLSKQSGIILILDALGIKQATISAAHSFLESRNLMLGILSSSLNQFLPALPLPVPTIYTFGDTLIMTYAHSTFAVSELVAFVAAQAKILIYLGLERGILFRGFITSGDYVTDGNSTLVGPAISELVSYYEEPQLVGAFLTPETGKLFDIKYDATNLSTTYDSFLLHKYLTPLKRGGSINLWSVAWPAIYMQKFSSDASVHFKTHLFKKDISYGSEPKFDNTLKYFRDCLAQKEEYSQEIS